MKFAIYLRLASMLPSVLFLLLPGTLYFFNRTEWSGDGATLLFFAACWPLSILLLAVIAPLFVARARYYAAAAIFALGLLVLANDLLAPLQLGILDGGVQHSEEPLWATLVELVAALLIVVLVYRTDVIAATWPIALSTVTFAAGVLLIVVSLVADGLERYPGKDIVDNPGTSNASVYHIHLDGMQTDYFKRYIQRSGREDELRGFTLFEDNTSNYPFTVPSIASYLTGTSFKGGDYLAWLNSANSGLPIQLRDQGYTLSYYGKRAMLDPAEFHYSVLGSDLMAASVQLPQMAEFSSLWLARVLPNVMTNRALDLGRRLGATIQAYAGQRGDSPPLPLTIDAGVEPYAGKLLMERLVADEPGRSGKGQYVLAQPILPHGPYVLDANCELIDKPSHAPREFYKQVSCGADLLLAFLAELKRLDRFDDALIVVNADHGGVLGLLAEDDVLGDASNEQVTAPAFLKWRPGQVLSRTRALLMIKPPGAEGALHYSKFPSQNLDLYPTVMALLGLTGEPGEGVNLYVQQDETVARERLFHLMQPGRSSHKEFESYRVERSEVGGQLSLRKIAGLSDEDRSPLQCGEQFNFADSEQASKLGSKGLTPVKDWGRATDGERVEVRFNYREKNCQGRKLLISSNAYVSVDNPLMQVDVSINGKLLGTMVFEYEENPEDYAPRVFEFVIPPDTLHGDKLNSLVFDVEGAVSPASIGKSRDKRLLGLSLSQLTIGPVEPDEAL